MDAQAYLGAHTYWWLKSLRGGPRKWLDEETRTRCIGWSCTMILRYGQTWGQGMPDIKPDAMLDVRELMDYVVVNVYNPTLGTSSE